ncbi:filaggrin [Dendroctonus ponderosae]|uniref:filaggrin n=1 Tax=Dendroctonus ponderosae TaxID=77166 RepID=UPI00203624A0|nr:filaggrin [Dendroctonus ponderosae]KAH1026793.1 hypothetical protein HUJ05_000411 [Dendroctonus ponderosae]
MKLIVGNSKHWPMLVCILVLVCISASVGRHIPQDFDLESSAAEPRPIFIETGPSAEALPLVYDADGSNGPLTDASEKVEKVLKPALSFSYNPHQFVDQDREPAESKHQDQNTDAGGSYYKYLETDEKKDGAVKEKTEEQAKGDLEAGGEGAESKHHDKKHDDGGNHNAEFEKGGGKDFHAHHHGEHGDKGEKGYKGHHQHEKALKGHHDKENHHHGYGEEGAHKKEHHHEDGYHGEHHKSHGGKKGAKFSEEGQHNKGHSTKGSHSIHKKDEYEKKTEFFEEDHEGGDSEKHGGFSHKNEYKKGGHQKSGHKKGGHQEGHHGRKGANAKGGHYRDEHGHDSKGGHEHHHQHDTKHGHKQGASNGKKWGWRESKDSGGGGGGGGGHDDGGAHSHQTYIVQAAPKNGETAHTHQSYAVQSPPPNHVVAVGKAPYQNYQISPISTFVLPLEGEPEIGGQKLSDGARQPSEYVATAVPKKNLKLKKRRPSPTEEFLADNPYSSEESRESDSPSSISPVELFIQQESLKQETKGGAVYAKPAESKKVTKKRRLKKKKIQKDAKAEASGRSARGLPDCLHGHRREKNSVPQESSHSFVIVAADDAA